VGAGKSATCRAIKSNWDVETYRSLIHSRPPANACLRTRREGYQSALLRSSKIAEESVIARPVLGSYHAFVLQDDSLNPGMDPNRLLLQIHAGAGFSANQADRSPIGRPRASLLMLAHASRYATGMV